MAATVLGLCPLSMAGCSDTELPKDPQTTTPPANETTPQPQQTDPVETQPMETEPAETQPVESPSAAYRGKIISVLGDSISTYLSYIPKDDGYNLAHQTRYPDGDVRKVDDTWWMQVINALDAKLGINDSWKGTTVINNVSADNGIQGSKTSMVSLTRIQNLGANGTPDIILFYGGTNDIIQGHPMGAFNANNAPEKADLSATRWNTVAECYVETILRLRHCYPDAHIVAILPAPSTSYSTAKLNSANNVFTRICQYYSIPYIDLRDSGITAEEHLYDGLHPNTVGMDIITDLVLQKLYSECPVEPGEAVLLSVTHDLTRVEASRGFCQKVTAGTAFTETVVGENVSVTVTMGGEDITARCFSDGTVSIPAVTGDLVITARGTTPAPHTKYLRQLPDEELCGGTNLWPLVESGTYYYASSGWTEFGGNLRSITIPVKAGDRISATSFDSGKKNGSGGTNGVRVTFFTDTDVLTSIGAAAVYSEFKQNGYITVPEGATAVNIPIWDATASPEVYLVNLPHTPSEGTCTICQSRIKD